MGCHARQCYTVSRPPSIFAAQMIRRDNNAWFKNLG
jgi:hypothetical protein